MHALHCKAIISFLNILHDSTVQSGVQDIFQHGVVENMWRKISWMLALKEQGGKRFKLLLINTECMQDNPALKMSGSTDG